MRNQFAFCCFCFAALLWGASCAEFSPAETKAQLEVKKYFDLEGFMQAEIERLAGKSGFTKTTALNGEEETRSDAKVDLEKELSIFSNSDINRPAWSDKYSVDSLFNAQGQLTKLTYSALDPELRTQKIEVDYDGAEVSRINIQNGNATYIASTQQLLTYDPAAGYAIESRQQVKTVDDATLRIQVKY